MFTSRNSRYLKKQKKTEIEPQEIFLDKLAQKQEQEHGLSEKKLETPLARRMLKAFLILSLLLLFALFLKTFHLQAVGGANFKNELKKNNFIIYSIQAVRGVIYDKNGEQLVFNKPGFDLTLNKQELPQEPLQKSKLLRKISQILSIRYSELRKKIDNSKEPQLLIAENLDHQALILLEAKINQLPGFKIKNTTIREYSAGSEFSHLLGYTGKISSEEFKKAPELYSIFDYVGKDGLEKTYEKTLQKTSGKLQVERDAIGNVISEKIISPAEPGKSLVLWLDSALQKKMAEALQAGIKNVGSQKGTVVAISPKTGGIMGLVSFPFFDNNLFNKKAEPELLDELLNNKEQALFNRAISGLYPVGSTVKPLLAAAGLEEEIISPDKYINDDKGFIAIKNPYYPDIEPEYYKYYDWKTHGLTDMRKAIAESCNVYFYILGGGYEGQQGLGVSRIKKYLELFGWGNLTGIDLPSEKQGVVPDPSWKRSAFENQAGQVWYDGDTYNLSIGQGYISTTPLQVASAFAALANKGKLFQPQVVRKIINGPPEQNSIVREFEPKIIRQNFISPENIEIVRQGMRQAVTAGSAVKWLNSLLVPVAAKTGTAQSSKKDYYHNWVTVFGPYQDPEIVLTVLIENVEEARIAALPIAREILEWYFSQ